MARPEPVGDVAVIPGALIDILDQKRDRRTGRLPLKHAGEDFYLVRLAALRRVAGLTRPPPVEPVLDVGLGEREARGHAIDDDADRRPVALAPGRETKKGSKAIAGHLSAFRRPQYPAHRPPSCRRRDSRYRHGAPRRLPRLTGN